MIVVKPTTDPQVLDIVPRDHTSMVYSITIVDERSNLAVISTVSGVYSNGRLALTVSYDFKAESFYTISVRSLTGSGDYALEDYALEDYYIGDSVPDEIYRGIVYATDQTDLEKYNSNDIYGEYETTTTFKTR